jgi:hypothetical protein
MSADSSIHREGGDQRSSSSHKRRNGGTNTKKGGQASSRSTKGRVENPPVVDSDDEPPRKWDKHGLPIRGNGYNYYGGQSDKDNAWSILCSCFRDSNR